jgi:hypothetical protein
MPARWYDNPPKSPLLTAILEGGQSWPQPAFSRLSFFVAMKVKPAE